MKQNVCENGKRLWSSIIEMATRAVLTHSESILFADWGGDPVSSRSTGDAKAFFAQTESYV